MAMTTPSKYGKQNTKGPAVKSPQQAMGQKGSVVKRGKKATAMTKDMPTPGRMGGGGGR